MESLGLFSVSNLAVFLRDGGRFGVERFSSTWVLKPLRGAGGGGGGISAASCKEAGCAGTDKNAHSALEPGISCEI